MTQEEKNILLEDLVTRLPYRVKFPIQGKDKVLYESIGDIHDTINGWTVNYHPIEEIKPCLRSMSSMTGEEKEELLAIIGNKVNIICEQLKNNDYGIKEGKYHFNSTLELEFLLSHHFDFKNLIEKGLALEAPEGMYNVK